MNAWIDGYMDEEQMDRWKLESVEGRKEGKKDGWKG